ncbi:metal ABC transporter ATP-binding protein [Streptococcus sciuri]|uniref:ABC transporter ATP-binding protein n=1 Tax=Streptococcus sciuri TaxID=2973939 RepID=A0ABT2F514_9STRE|nr:ABC transporter ATP-binding protein [Streptococcus sciuri]MCS4487554.1 ABC transporter ATP-binding protein [Streptococcus sciuri]
MVMLKVDNLSYFYENGEGIKNISFELEYGDFLAVIGKSGAGKSTLINSILGILPKKEGEVLIDDELSPKDISFCPQNQAIDWYLNVFDNVYMEALFSGSINAKAETINVLNTIGLGGKEKEDPTNLSGGQLQRVQLARQLVSNAKILILDEPTSSLDVITSENILNQLSSQTQDGKICIISSHDLDMLEKYCNKVLYIENGKVTFFGEIDRFLKHYNNLSEYKIFYDNQIPEEVEKNINDSFRVLNWNPLTIEVHNEQSINSILKLFIEHDIVVRSIEQNNRSLKEIIQLNG